MSGPGKLNTSQWEKNSGGGGGGAAAPAGNRGKIAMFEQAAKEAAPKEVKVKKTWKSNGHSGGYSNQGKFNAKTQIGDGPPAAKSLADLP
mmetsp:Transcript_710/g.2526  ORF Transcript_710/g.2526 Transcript_710/m.2526 type:complete len:90 (+) Transcript_710:53-322(+)|eukprot:CAMPEP_0114626246 /NCGR_PEP_ID=MMETSP0168-20121206/11681_1 /TAXON_ID=95228 ORGANISM="Vannella sp., Strain DIVA3 517/6/12" /NCGR_SAMPLE_ID=MMETSP0168 /ASSEMBLY_ACC=CAM_ASM_000044 /LENGTH=89 /DNA_ID=CAMNT_0001837541 /DNA_START=33 /DNA_END=302 /DNA_ORIENTATION=+